MAELTRRTLLALGGAAGLWALAGPAEATTAVTSVLRPRSSAAIGNRASFSHLVGQSVTATGGSGTHRLTLVGIEDVSHTVAGSARSFNLIFRPTDGRPFVEGIYCVTGARLSATALLLTSVGASGSTRRIQALINRGH